MALAKGWQLPVSPGLRDAYGSELWSCLWYGACSAFTLCWISNNPCVLGEHCSFILAVEQQTEAVEWVQYSGLLTPVLGFLSWGIELYLESSQLNIWWQLDDSFVRFPRCMSPLHQWICFCSRQVVMTSSAWNAQKAVLQSHPILSSDFFLHFAVTFFFTVCINSPPRKNALVKRRKFSAPSYVPKATVSHFSELSLQSVCLPCLIHLSTPGSPARLRSGVIHLPVRLPLILSRCPGPLLWNPPVTSANSTIITFIKQECHCFKCTNIFPARSHRGTN